MAFARRAAPLLLTLGLLVGSAAGLFALAFARYAPSSGTVWCILGATATFCSPARTLADQANTPLPLLVLAAAFNSALLAVLASAVALALGVPFGFWLALHAPRRAADALRAVTNLGVAFPAFFVAFLLQVLAVELGGQLGHSIVPVSGFGLDGHLVIPVIALALAPFAYITRLVAVGATDLAARDFVRTARAKGLSEIHVVYGHIAPNMLGALGEATFGGVRLVLAGLVIVEYLFTWPGLGYLLLRALRAQDLAALVAGVAVLGLLFLLVDLAIDVVTRRTGVVTG